MCFMPAKTGSFSMKQILVKIHGPNNELESEDIILLDYDDQKQTLKDMVELVYDVICGRHPTSDIFHKENVRTILRRTTEKDSDVSSGCFRLFDESAIFNDQPIGIVNIDLVK